MRAWPKRLLGGLKQCSRCKSSKLAPFLTRCGHSGCPEGVVFCTRCLDEHQTLFKAMATAAAIHFNPTIEDEMQAARMKAAVSSMTPDTIRQRLDQLERRVKELEAGR